MTLPHNFQFSQSNLQDYVECARRFELRHLQRLKWPAVETEPVAERERHMRLGAAFHHMVHQHLIGIPAEAIAYTAIEQPLRGWWENYLHANFVTQLPPRLYPETTLSIALNGYRLLAKYDLLAISPGEKVVIVDWKTADKRPRRDDLARRMQTIIYPYVLARVGAVLNDGQSFLLEQIEMVYWFAEDPAHPEQFVYDNAQFARDHDRLAGLINEIAARAEFPLTEDEHKCRFCVYRSLCRRGVVAGDINEMESLEEEHHLEMDFNFDQIAEVEF